MGTELVEISCHQDQSSGAHLPIAIATTCTGIHFDLRACLLFTVKTRRVIEQVLPGMGDIDVDLELDETSEKKKDQDGTVKDI